MNVTLTTTDPLVIELTKAEPPVIQLIGPDDLRFKIFYSNIGSIVRSGKLAVVAGEAINITFTGDEFPNNDYVLMVWVVEADGTIGFIHIPDNETNRTAAGFNLPEGIPVSGTLYYQANMG